MLDALIGEISNFMYGKLLIVMILGVGLYYTLRTRFIQIRLFGETLKVIMEKKEGQKVSSFQALMVSTASRVGTGNIIGVSTALCLGGFGSMFWMWLAAFLGGGAAFVESTLAQVYKKRGEHASYGGPAYYIESALHNRFVAIIFALALICTYGIGFNMLCAYNLQSTFSGFAFYNPDSTPWVIGGILAVLVGWCIFGGGRRIIKANSALVPFMGLIYVLVALIVVVMNIGLLPSVFNTIFTQAFDFQAIFGGFTGSCVMFGIKRGLFSNEAGVGSAPNAAAAADVSHPVKQGLVQMFSVFIDTMILCTATAFLCMSSGVTPTKELAGAPFVQAALDATLGSGAGIFLTVSMLLFAFTTLLGNLYYVDNCLAYVNGKVPGKLFMTIYRVFAALVIFVGSGLSMDLLWNLADVLMGCMAIINLPVIVILGKQAMACLNNYEEQRDAGKDPVFYAQDIGLTDNLDYWQK
ncbi:sodium/alanine symporter family protein [Anaerovibrio sp. JC8]|uniref:alanine/glycine:cation symporter family protein n=1 Tax=Anaerovibrio sp. JC8 TaxID=1240085 RepID=UPI000A0C087F|nr:alanine/glycine:cation symporter family protein [Anaerovibrio sp. JC8]ORT99639.1 sodium/alanine symporter family protein [Anaerovibrio sp. JC8]